MWEIAHSMQLTATHYWGLYCISLKLQKHYLQPFIVQLKWAYRGIMISAEPVMLPTPRVAVIFWYNVAVRRVGGSGWEQEEGGRETEKERERTWWFLLFHHAADGCQIRPNTSWLGASLSCEGRDMEASPSLHPNWLKWQMGMVCGMTARQLLCTRLQA